MGVGEVRIAPPEEMIAALDERIGYMTRRIEANIAKAYAGGHMHIPVPVDMSLLEQLAQVYLQRASFIGEDTLKLASRAMLLDPQIKLENPYHVRTDTKKNLHLGKATVIAVEKEMKVIAYDAAVAEEIGLMLQDMRREHPARLEAFADWDDDRKSMRQLISQFLGPQDITVEEMVQQLSAKDKR
jgi:hypothetical protein